LNSRPILNWCHATNADLEVYKEEIRDLLTKDNSNLKLREHKTKGFFVDGLEVKEVTSAADIFDWIELGDLVRTTGATSMNQSSSRSHSVLTLVLRKETCGSATSGRLNLVDLAGSERAAKAQTTGQRSEEAKKINQSLSELGNVINALADKKSHVPYRNSKLTRILKESLGGAFVRLRD
jgi:hypothetical protein